MDLLENLPARRTLPVFSMLKGASDGRFWVREYPDPTQDHATWIVLDEAMEPVERVEMPVDIRILDISRDQVLALARGIFGEHIVQVFDIER
jgi:hypothetical protein